MYYLPRIPHHHLRASALHPCVEQRVHAGSRVHFVFLQQTKRRTTTTGDAKTTRKKHAPNVERNMYEKNAETNNGAGIGIELKVEKAQTQTDMQTNLHRIRCSMLACVATCERTPILSSNYAKRCTDLTDRQLFLLFRPSHSPPPAIP